MALKGPSRGSPPHPTLSPHEEGALRDQIPTPTSPGPALTPRRPLWTGGVPASQGAQPWVLPARVWMDFAAGTARGTWAACKERCGPGRGRGEVRRRRAGCTGRGSAEIQPGRGRKPGAGSQSRSSENGSLTTMGRGSRRAQGSPALQLLLLLRLSWPVWGAEVSRGEWERALRGRRGHCLGMMGLRPRERGWEDRQQGGFERVSVGPTQGLSPALELGAQTCIL